MMVYDKKNLARWISGLRGGQLATISNLRVRPRRSVNILPPVFGKTYLVRFGGGRPKHRLSVQRIVQDVITFLEGGRLG